MGKILIGALTAMILPVSVVSASIQFNVDFSAETDTTPDTQPAVANSVNTELTNWTTNKSSSVTIQPNFPGGTTDQNVLLINAHYDSQVAGSNARADIFMNAAGSDATTTGRYSISFDVYYTGIGNNGPTDYLYVTLRDGGTTQVGGFGIKMSDGTGYLNAGKDSSNAGYHGGTVSSNTVHHLELLVDLDANTETLILDHTTTLGTNALTATVIPFQQLTINTGNNAQALVYVDNVVVTPVPEPSALDLVGSGTLAMLYQAKKKARR